MIIITTTHMVKYVVSKVRDNYVKIATPSYNIVATEND